MDKKFVIKQNQRKQFLLILLSIIMLSGAFFVFFYNKDISEIKYINKIIGAIGIIFFGACLIFIIKRFIKPKDILVIDQNGILDNSTAVSIGFIPWNEIKSVYINRVFTETFICVEVENIEEKLKGLSFFKRNMIKFNLKMGNAPVSITLNSTNYKPEEVLEIIKNYKEVHIH